MTRVISYNKQFILPEDNLEYERTRNGPVAFCVLKELREWLDFTLRTEASEKLDELMKNYGVEELL